MMLESSSVRSRGKVTGSRESVLNGRNTDRINPDGFQVRDRVSSFDG